MRVVRLPILVMVLSCGCGGIRVPVAPLLETALQSIEPLDAAALRRSPVLKEYDLPKDLVRERVLGLLRSSSVLLCVDPEDGRIAYLVEEQEPYDLFPYSLLLEPAGTGSTKVYVATGVLQARARIPVEADARMSLRQRWRNLGYTQAEIARLAKRDSTSTEELAARLEQRQRAHLEAFLHRLTTELLGKDRWPWLLKSP